jgi:hypothetical protein
LPLGRQQNDLAGIQPGQGGNGSKEGLRLEHHAHPTPVGLIIDTAVLVGGEVAWIGAVDFGDPLL